MGFTAKSCHEPAATVGTNALAALVKIRVSPLPKAEKDRARLINNQKFYSFRYWASAFRVISKVVRSLNITFSSLSVSDGIDLFQNRIRRPANFANRPNYQW
jgi:hypothetical protein